MVRRSIIFLIILFLLISHCLTADAGEKTSSTLIKNKFRVGLVTDVGGRGDKSFNDSAYEGLRLARRRLKIKGDVAEPANKAEELQHLFAFAKSGYDLIIGVGFGMEDAIEEVAREFPNRRFAIVDGNVNLPNVANLRFKEHEGSFLVGALAALMSETGIIGFLGGMEIPLIKKFEIGYLEGAQRINPDIKVLVSYTGTDPSAWNDPVRGRELSLIMIGQGADVLYHAAGGTGSGMIGACRDREVYAIGVDSNQDDLAPGTVLTSMLKRCDAAVFSIIEQTLNDNFQGGAYVLGVAEDGVDTTDFKHTKQKIGAEKLQRLNELRRKIIAGEIKVTDAMLD